MLRSLFLSSFNENRLAVSEKDAKNVSVNLKPGGHLIFLINPKNTDMVEDVEILIPVRFR